MGNDKPSSLERNGCLCLFTRKADDRCGGRDSRGEVRSLVLVVMDPWMLGEDIIVFVDRCSVLVDGAAPTSPNNGGGDNGSGGALSREVAAQR
jgi:hypothetical protein